MIPREKVYGAKKIAKETLWLLREVDRRLKSARNWGIYDIMGGGFLSSIFKHSKVNKAEALLQDVRNKLGQLQKELGQIQLNVDPQLRISGFEKFLDIAFDNIISDWLVQSKIRNTRKEVSRLQSDVQEIIRALDEIELKKI